ncbi:hypothetical protein COV05_02180 [Candidatus Uhrbacteria bacterium CG10_big_fil_rev_8_21_14_0_10_48_16]|uniref:HAD family hydrolase n=1 Tax=Candidatus Uhrbacteria bacterium CG10_big_fil_rev_8_21_14_0_10_48_16 TaxID=1975038 RepID=A0A2M8LHR0_9BACT|nr:MAG: hypothetical protein COV05_02180 [Candidatus Uhrbacteria bacterium CG10_big_fil_rev_8_21_14_0_10_48_16]
MKSLENTLIYSSLQNIEPIFLSFSLFGIKWLVGGDMRQQDIILWDFDHTILNTEQGLYGPLLDQLAKEIARERQFVDEMFVRANDQTFTFSIFFELLGIDRSLWGALEAELQADLRRRMPDCLYPGVLEVIKQQHERGSRQVLVTAGDPDYQRWKFGSLESLQPFFASEDRHFVPLSGSKADVVVEHLDLRHRLTFIDDSARWHYELLSRTSRVRHLRAMWPDTLGVLSHRDDGYLWGVFQSAEELKRLLANDR